MIKILIINTVNFSYSNGISNVILNYYRNLDKSNIIIDFVVKQCLDDELKFEIMKNGGKLYELGYRLKSPLKYIRDVTKIIEKNKYDIVHAHGNSCTLAIEMLAAKKGGTKIRIAHSHNTTTKYKIVHKFLRKTFENNYTYGFACGVDAGKWLFKDKPFSILRNGIDAKKFQYNSELRHTYRNKLGLEGCKVIGHVGSFNYQKNHEFLIKIFKELYTIDNSYRLLLVGEGNLKSEIEEKIASMGLTNVTIFIGKSREVPQLMQAIDMFIMPSLYEGLPLTLVEAQAAGLPCFVSDNITKEVNITNLIKHIPLNKSPKEWAEEIIKTDIIDRELNKYKIQNLIIEAGYDIKTNAKKLKNNYLDLINDINAGGLYGRNIYK